MKVLYLNPTVEIGGAERSLLELVSGIDREKVEPVAACVGDGPLPRALSAAGARVIFNPLPAFALKIGRGALLSKLILPFAAVSLLPHLLRMASLVRREKIAVIHTNGLKSHLVGALAGILTGCPVVWHVRDILKPGLTRRAFGLLARLGVGRLIANSRATAATFPGLPAGRVEVIHNGIDLRRFTPGPKDQAMRASFGAGDGDFVVGAIGALAPLKGHIHLIRAMPSILARCPNARLAIVGEEMYLTFGHGGYRAALESEVRKLGLSERVVLAGRREDPAAVLAGFDLLVHASVYPESFGRVLIEAMACGVPVVATDLGGPREIIETPAQGTLIPAEDPEAIAEAVIRLHGDATLRKGLSKAGRARVESAFGIERCVREVEAVYASIAGGLRG